MLSCIMLVGWLNNKVKQRWFDMSKKGDINIDISKIITTSYELGKIHKQVEIDSECVKKLNFIHYNIQNIYILLAMIFAVLLAFLVFGVGGFV
jgi:uncharacterized Tic20 family protein